MKREKDEITDLFRSRLDNVELPVRDGFWEDLNQGLTTCQHRRRLVFYRITAAASVLLVLAASSAAFWYFSPKEEMEKVFSEIAVANTGSMDGDVVKQEFSPIHAQPILQKPISQHFQRVAVYDDVSDDSTSVTLSMSFHFSMTSTERRGGSRNNQRNDDLWQAGTVTEQTTAPAEQDQTATVLMKTEKLHRWTLKAAVGTSLPAVGGDYKMPVTVGLTVGKHLTHKVVLESGLQYSCLRSDGQNLHYLGIPVKMNVTLIDNKKFDLYATVGGIADKCISGAPDNSFKSEPMQLAVTAGVGVSYKINENMALFAEPGVSHHFGTDSALRTVRTARPTNFNLICGLRMTY